MTTNELYQEVILHHYKAPRNYGKPAAYNHAAVGHNPLCGDKLVLYLTTKDGVVEDVHFEGEGCAISTASASLMTEALRGKTAAEAEALFQEFHALVTGEAPAHPEALGKLAVLSGVSEFPARVKCASLAWHTFLAALKDQEETVTTE